MTTAGLSELKRTLERDLALTAYPNRDWLEPLTLASGKRVLDVLIIGGGQSGMATAALLRRERVDNILVVDRNPEDRAGPWLGFARMITLRTPKHVTGPDLGIPSLTIQAWYEAQQGLGSWEQLNRIPKETWAAYLAWYRRVLNLPVRFETTAGAIEFSEQDHCFRVPLSSPAGTETAFARRIVLATGIEGSGDWYVPPVLSEALPRDTYAHTSEAIDFGALSGKRVGVLGAGASAFDNAAVALEHGAKQVTLCFRRPELVAVNAYRWAEFVGFLKHMADLPDPEKWRFVRQLIRMGQLPPADTLERARAQANFEMAPATPWTAARMEGRELVIDTPKGPLRFDYAIFATGFRTDLRLRPELAACESLIARWADRYTPKADEAHDDLARHPYLGPCFELTEREPGRAPWLSGIFNYTFGGLLSLGFGGASISGMKYSLPRLVHGITASLFREDQAAHFAGLCAYEQKEFDA